MTKLTFINQFLYHFTKVNRHHYETLMIVEKGKVKENNSKGGKEI